VRSCQVATESITYADSCSFRGVQSGGFRATVGEPLCAQGPAHAGVSEKQHLCVAQSYERGPLMCSRFRRSGPGGSRGKSQIKLTPHEQKARGPKTRRGQSMKQAYELYSSWPHSGTGAREEGIRKSIACFRRSTHTIQVRVPYDGSPMPIRCSLPKVWTPALE